MTSTRIKNISIKNPISVMCVYEASVAYLSLVYDTALHIIHLNDLATFQS